jgi:hypothetical protein
MSVILSQAKDPAQTRLITRNFCVTARVVVRSLGRRCDLGMTRL